MTSLPLGFTSLIFLSVLHVQAALIPFVIEGEEATWVKRAHGNAASGWGGFVELQGETWLHVGRNDDSTATSGYYYNAGETTATENNQFADFTGSVIFMKNNLRPSTGGGVAVRGRSQTATNGANGAFRSPDQYLIQVNGNNLGIWYGVGDAQDPGISTALVYSPFEEDYTFDTDVQYQLTFSVIGSVIEAEVFLWNVENNVRGESVAYVIYTEATERSTGYVGVRGFHSGGPHSRYYRDFHITTVIPEPGLAVSLLAVGVLGSLFYSRSKRLRKVA